MGLLRFELGAVDAEWAPPVLYSGHVRWQRRVYGTPTRLTDYRIRRSIQTNLPGALKVAN